MTGGKRKPQGTSGPISLGGGGANWNIIAFPETKEERERLIAKLFVGGFGNWVAMESEPSLAPFGEPIQNAENDLDFTISTSEGPMLMELAEFAPLKALMTTFQAAPKSMHPTVKAPLALDLIAEKSAHQGGANRFLVVYATEHGFWLDPITIEILRRRLVELPPKFERVYWVSPHDQEQASVSEIYPGKPHHIFGEFPDAKFEQMNVTMPHPTEMSVETSFEVRSSVNVGGRRVSVSVRVNYTGLRQLKR